MPPSILTPHGIVFMDTYSRAAASIATRPSTAASISAISNARRSLKKQQHKNNNNGNDNSKITTIATSITTTSTTLPQVYARQMESNEKEAANNDHDDHPPPHPHPHFHHPPSPYPHMTQGIQEAASTSTQVACVNEVAHDTIIFMNECLPQEAQAQTHDLLYVHENTMANPHVNSPLNDDHDHDHHHHHNNNVVVNHRQSQEVMTAPRPSGSSSASSSASSASSLTVYAVHHDALVSRLGPRKER
jgi:hypothetical protein